jgi:AcrR family transcriptional regulator
MNTPTPPNARTKETREQLLRAATSAFALHGFHATSLKTIAEQAQINQALIAYHFGGKDGLYLAVFEAIVQQLQARIGERVEAIASLLTAPPAPAGQERAALLPVVYALSDAMTELFTSEQSRDWALLISREQSAPTAAFELLYEGYMGRVLNLLAQLIQRIRPQASAQECRLLVVTLLGQTLAYRIARTGVLRLLGWEQIGPAEVSLIKAQLRRNIDHLLLE